MEEKTKLSHYSFRYNPDLGIPVVIITCSANTTFNKYFAEYYLFFSKTNRFIGGKISSEPHENLYIKIDFDFMFQEALKAAQNRIDNYLFELNEETKNTHHLHYDIQLHESNSIGFIQLIKSKIFYKELVAIRNKTKCKELQSLIDIVIDSEIKYDFEMKDFTLD